MAAALPFLSVLLTDCARATELCVSVQCGFGFHARPSSCFNPSYGQTRGAKGTRSFLLFTRAVR